MFLDADFDPMVTCKTPGDDRDILTASANNLYDGVTMADLERFQERYPLNSRVAVRNGSIIEEVYRVGGLYDAEISRVVATLTRGGPLRTRSACRGPLRADPLVRNGRRGGSRGIRYRVGAESRLNGRHDEWLHRGLPRCTRHQRRVGRRRVLRQSRQDRKDPAPCDECAVV